MQGKDGSEASGRYLDLQGLAFLVHWHARSIALLAVMGGILGMAFAWSQRTLYIADASLQVDRSERSPVAEPDSLRVIDSLPERSATEMALIKSRSVLARAIRGRLSGDVAMSAVARDVGGSSSKGQAPALRAETIDIRRVRSRLDIAEQGKDSGMLRVSYGADDPDNAKHMLQAILDSYLAIKRERFAEEVSKQEIMLEKQMPLLRAQYEEVRGKMNRVNESAQSTDMQRESERLTRELADIESNIGDLAVQRTELAQRYKQAHPAYQALLEKTAYFKKRKDDVSNQIAALPKQWQALVDLMKDDESILSTYGYLLEKRHRLHILKVRDADRGWLVDEVEIGAVQHALPRRLLVIFGGLLGGALVGVVRALWRYMAGGVIYFQRDVREEGFIDVSYRRSRVGSRGAAEQAIWQLCMKLRRECPQAGVIAVHDETDGDNLAVRLAMTQSLLGNRPVLAVLSSADAIVKAEMAIEQEGWKVLNGQVEASAVWYGKGGHRFVVSARSSASEECATMPDIAVVVTDTTGPTSTPPWIEVLKATNVALFSVRVGNSNEGSLREFRHWAADMGVMEGRFYALFH
jgi:uncharacterized protein involved in exopolysaccharide biosynthesis